MKFSICADIMYNKMPFSEKLHNIKKNGFNTIEFWKWSNKDIDEIKEVIEKEDLTVSCFCIDSPDNTIMDEIGSCLLNSGKNDKLIEIVNQSIEVAKKLGTKALITTVGDMIEGISKEQQISNVYDSLNAVKTIFEENKITLLVEPINTQERPNYLLANVKQVAKIVNDINSPYVKVLYDIYHQAMENDFCAEEMADILPLTGHIHIADVPGRNEPGTGRIDYDKAIRVLHDNGYTGYIGAEFVPSKDKESVFDALKKY